MRLDLALLTLVGGAVSFIGTWAWQNRKRIQIRFFKVTVPLPTQESRGPVQRIILKPSDDSFEGKIREERLIYASDWIRQMPGLPPNCEAMQIVMHYDDGKQLSMTIRQGDQNEPSRARSNQ